MHLLFLHPCTLQHGAPPPVPSPVFFGAEPVGGRRAPSAHCGRHWPSAAPTLPCHYPSPTPCMQHTPAACQGVGRGWRQRGRCFLLANHVGVNHPLASTFALPPTIISISSFSTVCNWQVEDFVPPLEPAVSQQCVSPVLGVPHAAPCHAGARPTLLWRTWRGVDGWWRLYCCRAHRVARRVQFELSCASPPPPLALATLCVTICLLPTRTVHCYNCRSCQNSRVLGGRWVTQRLCHCTGRGGCIDVYLLVHSFLSPRQTTLSPPLAAATATAGARAGCGTCSRRVRPQAPRCCGTLFFLLWQAACGRLLPPVFHVAARCLAQSSLPRCPPATGCAAPNARSWWRGAFRQRWCETRFVFFLSLWPAGDPPALPEEDPSPQVAAPGGAAIDCFSARCPLRVPPLARGAPLFFVALPLACHAFPCDKQEPPVLFARPFAFCWLFAGAAPTTSRRAPPLACAVTSCCRALHVEPGWCFAPGCRPALCSL